MIILTFVEIVTVKEVINPGVLVLLLTFIWLLILFVVHEAEMELSGINIDIAIGGANKNCQIKIQCRKYNSIPMVPFRYTNFVKSRFVHEPTKQKTFILGIVLPIFHIKARVLC